MTQVKLICLCGLLLVCSAIAKLECGPNEIEVDCASECSSDFCPKSVGGEKACPQPRECPAPACKCQFNYRRAENRTCIPTKQCPPFECNGPHEVYDPCPPLCSDDCSSSTAIGECPPTFGFILIVLPCSPTCRCEKGHWRKNGKCVPYVQCPKEQN